MSGHVLRTAIGDGGGSNTDKGKRILDLHPGRNSDDHVWFEWHPIVVRLGGEWGREGRFLSLHIVHAARFCK